MKLLALFSVATLAAATPLAVPAAEVSAEAGETVLNLGGAPAIEARQLGSSAGNELERGSAANCPGVILIFARGSTESGTLGSLGGPVGNALKTRYGSSGVWVQGVGGPYDASIGANTLPRGTTAASIREAVRLYDLAASKCPQAKIVSGGYSQGGAVIGGAIQDLTPAVRARVVGNVMFGWSKQQQQRNMIPGFPQESLMSFCNVGDGVCRGSLSVSGPHLRYASFARSDAPAFLISRVGN